jgi:hypothetical protein
LRNKKKKKKQILKYGHSLSQHAPTGLQLGAICLSLQLNAPPQALSSTDLGQTLILSKLCCFAQNGAF